MNDGDKVDVCVCQISVQFSRNLLVVRRPATIWAVHGHPVGPVHGCGRSLRSIWIGAMKVSLFGEMWMKERDGS